MLNEKPEEPSQNHTDNTHSIISKTSTCDGYQSPFTESIVHSFIGANVHVQNNQAGRERGRGTEICDDGGSDMGGESGSREDESNYEADSADDNYFAVHSTMDGV